MDSDDRSGGTASQEADRAAIEQITRRRLPATWPEGAMRAGTRVRVVQDASWNGPWAEVFTGTVSDMGAPELVIHSAAQAGEFSYWVEFDSPQIDGNGDGPYRKAQIWGRYVEPIQNEE